MKISELIKKLEEAKENFGDINILLCYHEFAEFVLAKDIVPVYDEKLPESIIGLELIE